MKNDRIDDKLDDLSDDRLDDRLDSFDSDEHGDPLHRTVMKRITLFLAPGLIVSDELLQIKDETWALTWAYENDRSLIKQKVEKG